MASVLQGLYHVHLVHSIAFLFSLYLLHLAVCLSFSFLLLAVSLSVSFSPLGLSHSFILTSWSLTLLLLTLSLAHSIYLFLSVSFSFCISPQVQVLPSNVITLHIFKCHHARLYFLDWHQFSWFFELFPLHDKLSHENLWLLIWRWIN